MSVNVGSIHYVVDVKTEGLLRAEREVDASMRSVEKSTERADHKFNNLTASIKRATVALISITAAQAAIKAVTSQVAEFEQSLLTVRAVTRATEDQMASLEKQARELGATTSFAAKQAADAQGELARMGFEVNEVLAVTPGVLKFAMAAELGLADASKIASGTLRGMRLEVDQMPRVMDVLAATAANAGTNVMQMGEAMTNAAPFAAGLGVEIEETSAALGILANSNIQGGSSGTALMSLFRQLSNITPQARKQLEAYGLSVEDLSVRTRGLANVMDSLMQSGIMTNDGAMFQVFGSEGQAAAQILMNNVTGLREFTGELQNASGEVDKMAEILGSGLSTSMKGFGSAVSEAVLVLGRDSGFGAALQGVLDTSAGVINNLSGMTEQMGALGEEGGVQQIVINGLADGLRLLAAIMAGRLAGAVVTNIGGFMAARREAYRYQMALATMSGVSHRAATAQLAMAGATRAASAAFALIGGPAGAVVIAALALYHFRDELNLTRPVIGHTEDELAALRAEMKAMDSSEIVQTLTEVEAALEEVGMKAALAREELAKLRNEDRGSGALGFSGGQVGAETRGMQAVSEYEQKLARLQQRRTELMRERGSRNFKPLDDWLFEGEKSPPSTPSPPPETESGGSGEAKRRQREFEAVQRQLATEREAIEREYQERNRIIRENTLEGSEQQLELLERSAAERKSRQSRITERLLSGLRTETEAIKAEYERRRQEILDSTTPGAEQDDLLERNRQARGRAVDDFTGDAPGTLTGGEYDNQFSRYEQDAEIERERYQAKLQRLQEAREEELLTQQDYNKREQEAAQVHADRLMQIEQAKSSMMVSTASNMFGDLSGLAKGFAGEQSSIYRAMFAASKAFAIADAAVKIQQGIANAAALPWPANLGAIASTVAATTSILGAIQSTSMPGYASGGYTGSGSRNEPAGIVHRGEFVMPKRIVDQPGVRAQLEAMRLGFNGDSMRPADYPINESGEKELILNNAHFTLKARTLCHQ